MRITIFFLCFSATALGQTSEQLMQYAEHYDGDIQSFQKFIILQPSVDEVNFGVRQMVYELDNHRIGIQEHPTGNGKIGEIYVFQTSENFTKASYLWKSHFDSMKADRSLIFVKAVFDDGVTKENELMLEEFSILMNTRNINSKTSYGVRFQKNSAYYSLFIIKGKLVFTVDDKNF